MVARAGRLRRRAAPVVLGVARPAPAAERLLLSAASRLTNAFRERTEAFPREAPQVEVTLNIGSFGSQLQQIDRGAPVDFFAVFVGSPAGRTILSRYGFDAP